MALNESSIQFLLVRDSKMEYFTKSISLRLRDGIYKRCSPNGVLTKSEKVSLINHLVLLSLCALISSICKFVLQTISIYRFFIHVFNVYHTCHRYTNQFINFVIVKWPPWPLKRNDVTEKKNENYETEKKIKSYCNVQSKKLNRLIELLSLKKLFLGQHRWKIGSNIKWQWTIVYR